ncbi:hypothetical protein ACIRU3_07160 [Streptomyces sp. NPDC101151]|uniref:hypothetical protein n=1 Tax=Streptomyces sp. NPDC101151 TaxID=3366115 RepID=UPI00381A2EF5
MSRGPGRVQRAIIAALTEARTSEPYPVDLSWTGLSARVYAGHIPSGGTPTAAQIEQVRRACRKHPGIMSLHWDISRHAYAAMLQPTEAEMWLSNAVQSDQDLSGEPARPFPTSDDPRYRPPTREEVWAGYGKRRPTLTREGLDGVLALLGAFYGAHTVAGEVELWECEQREIERQQVQARARREAGGPGWCWDRTGSRRSMT